MTPGIKNRLHNRAAKGFRGYPIATVAYYGPNASKATKAVAGIIARDGADAHPLQRWFGEHRDQRLNETITSQILRFVKEHGARTVAAVPAILGCPHEEGIDYAIGEPCPRCPYWAGRDRWADLTWESRG